MASRIRVWLDNGTVEQVLPAGYKYAFLVRHPAKALGSKLKGKHVEDGKTDGKTNESWNTVQLQILQTVDIPKINISYYFPVEKISAMSFSPEFVKGLRRTIFLHCGEVVLKVMNIISVYFMFHINVFHITQSGTPAVSTQRHVCVPLSIEKLDSRAFQRYMTTLYCSI